MAFPEPYPGLVIRYSYLWRREHEQGREEGAKDRPCAIVMAVTDEDGEWQVLVLPISHSPPPDPGDAIEIPRDTKKRLGLDFERSWIVLTEANEFLWPGPDLRPVPGGDTSTIDYGPLPPRFFAQVRDKFLERDRREKSAHTKRTEKRRNVLPMYSVRTLILEPPIERLVETILSRLAWRNLRTLSVTSPLTIAAWLRGPIIG